MHPKIIKQMLSSLRQALLCLTLTQLAASKCMFYQPSTTSIPAAALTEEQQTPQIYPEPKDRMTAICQDYIGKEVCCNEASREVMAINFLKLALIVECQNSKNNIYRMM